MHLFTVLNKMSQSVLGSITDITLLYWSQCLFLFVIFKDNLYKLSIL